MSEARVSETSCSTYFETLPDDVCVKLLEWLDTIRCQSSENERNPFMMASTREGKSFLSFLFSEDGPFCNVASSVATKVCLYPERDSTDVSIKYGWIDIGPELFEGAERKSGLVERILRVCGESTKEIVVAVDDAQLLHRGNGESGFIRQFESLVVQHCPAVERLEFDLAFLNEETVSTLLAAYSSQLRSIQWHLWGVGDGFSIPDFSNCTQLRQLWLPATPQLASLLECTGSMLESLFVSFITFDGYEEVIDAIERNCKKLMHIRLPDSRRFINSVGEERYAAFLSSFGSQLITAEIYGMVEPEHLRKVFTKCPNLDVERQRVEAHGIEEWERVRVFGPRIQNLLVDMIECTSEECCHAVSSCTSLSELTIYSFGDTPLEQDIIDTTIISVLSSLPTPSLKWLSLTGFRATKENVAIIAAATSNLTSIRLKLAEPLQDGSIFKNIVDSNPHLREVRVVEAYPTNRNRDAESAVGLLRVLVDTFAKCSSLMFVILNTGKQDVREETIRDICGSLPCRGIDVYVEIGSTSYGQTRRIGQQLIVPL